MAQRNRLQQTYDHRLRDLVRSTGDAAIAVDLGVPRSTARRSRGRAADEPPGRGVVRLLDGTKAFIHAVIDNYSRRILAWRVAERFEPGNAIAVPLDAIRHAVRVEEPPTVVAVAGVENINGAVDELIQSGACWCSSGNALF